MGITSDDSIFTHKDSVTFSRAGAKSAVQPVVSQEGQGSEEWHKIMGGVYLDYDKEDDVLHIHFGKPEACKTIETNENIYIRKTPQGILSAIEIWNYKKQVGSF